jgi:uncharacterized RDD family membrane protein YckC
MSDYGAQPPSYQPYQQAGPGGSGEAAGMGRRLGARLIDGLLVGAVYSVISLTVLAGAAGTGVFDQADPNGDLTGAQAGVVASLFTLFAVLGVITLLYEVSLIALKGATLGKMAVKIQVVRTDNGQVPGWGPSLIRWVIPQAAGLLCGIGQILVYLSPFFDGTGRQQGWHDKASGTVVVKT